MNRILLLASSRKGCELSNITSQYFRHTSPHYEELGRYGASREHQRVRPECFDPMSTGYP
jgi:hypothetical protein